MNRVVLLVVLLLAGCRSPHRSAPETEAAPSVAATTGPGVDKPEYVGAHQGTEVSLLVQVGEGPAREHSITVDADADARMGVVVQEGGRVYTDLPDVVLGGRRLRGEDLSPLAELPGYRKVWWYKVEAEKASYRNTDHNEGWWADIRYAETLWGMGEQGMRSVDVTPTLHEGVQLDGVQVGTMRFKAAVELQDRFLSTPGAASVEKAGALPGVLRVSRKGATGNRIVDHALSLANLPYIWGSAPVKGKGEPSSHQSEQYIGADCADMVVAAWRLSGSSDMDYSGVVPMVRELSGSAYGIEIAEERKGVLVDREGHEIRVGAGGARPGSAVMWRFGVGRRKGHAGVLVQDLGPGGHPDGLLGGDDLVLHTMWDTPRLQPLREVLTGLTPVAVINPVVKPRGKRWIEVDLSRQMLGAFQDGKEVYEFPISSGKDGSTPTGTFRIWRKNAKKDMKVGLVVLGKFFVLQDVPWILFYEGEGLARERGFAIHGTYWHDDFGKPVSHGCINMSVEDASVLYHWAGPVTGVDRDVTATEDNPGTSVIVKDGPP